MTRVSAIQLGAILAVLASTALAADAETQTDRSPARLLQRSIESDGDDATLHYYVYLPVGYESGPERRWPLMLFLHGDGERGDTAEELGWVLVHGPLYEAWIQKRDLPFVILSPQLPLFGRDEFVPYLQDRDPNRIPQRLEKGVPPREPDFPTPQPMTGATADVDQPLPPEGPENGWPRRERELIAALDAALETYRVDPDRVYLTGLSYGGYGSWYLASRHPERFAAIAPVVGWGHPELMPPLAEDRMPIWAFAGGRDPAVPVGPFYAGLNELERLGHPEVRFTVHEDMGHDTWKRVYRGQDLYDWLLEQSR